MDKQKEEILSLISGYYNNKKKALTWYDSPHKIISDKNESPKEMVESGKGSELLKWIKMVLDK